MSVAPGTAFGPYVVVEPIGAGGMGEVYRARDERLKRDVALKVLPEALADDDNRLARLQREAEVLAALSHANIAHIYGLERSGERTAIVMELIEGPTLADRIEQGPLPPNEALDVALQVAAALEAAHDRGIVHRDLKPANIKLRADGAVKVLDFGIAKSLEQRSASGSQPLALTTPSMTEAGVVLGTAAYMSPEQARGKVVDKRADIWAFGCVLYEMLTGQPAFQGADVTTTLARVLERDPDLRPLPARLSPAVRGALELCLRKDPARRIADIRDVRLAIAGEIVLAPVAPALWRRALPIAASLGAGALVAAAFLAVTVPARAPPAAPPVELPVTRFVIAPPATARLANQGGLDLAISPDGKRFVYIAESPATGSAALYVRELDGLEPRLVPGTEITDSRTTVNPFFSADGKSVGFSTGAGVMRVATDGGPVLKMFDAPQPAFVGATWGADETVIFSSGGQLHRVSAAGGQAPEPLTALNPNAVLANPHLLPGGRAVLFATIADGVERIGVLDLDSGEEKTLAEGGHPAYAATGHVLFARGTTLMAAPFDVAELALTGEPVAMQQNVRHPNPQTAPDYSLSATGTLVYVPADAGQSGRSALVWVDRGGNVIERAIGESLDEPRGPRLSPDGERLALILGDRLWIYDLRGRPPIPLTVADTGAAIWSPDSRQIAFSFRPGGADSALRALPADGSSFTPQPLLARGTGAGVPQFWSSAGEIGFLSSIFSAPNLRLVNAAGNEARDLVVTEYAEFDAALSPDGRWLAYVSNRTGQGEVWVQAYPDGVPVRVSSGGGIEPRWSADGRELFYLQGSAMMAVDVQSADEFSFAAPRTLFSGSYRVLADTFFGSYDVARDGRFLMMQTDDATVAPSNIVVIENWTEELKRRVPTRR